MLASVLRHAKQIAFAARFRRMGIVFMGATFWSAMQASMNKTCRVHGRQRT
jgi:hypothetical protein